MGKSKLLVVGSLMIGTLMLSAAPVLARDRHRSVHRRSYNRHTTQDYLLRNRHTMPDPQDFYYNRRDLRHDRRDARRDWRSGRFFGRH